MVWAGMASRESDSLESARQLTLQQLAEPQSDKKPNPAESDKDTFSIVQKPKSWQDLADDVRKTPAPKSDFFGDAVAIDAAKHAQAIADDYKHVVSDLDQVLRLDPKATWALYARGAICWSRGEIDKAFADYSEAIRIDPADVKLLNARSSLYAAKGEIDKAIADQNEIIRLDPKSAEAFKARGDLYARQQKIDKAAADYATAERLKPSDDRYR
jgi:tetratricopeptide (TPR) repeat protein